MVTAISGLSSFIPSRKPDYITQLCRRLDQYRRSAKRCGRIDLARDIGEAARLLRAYRLDEETFDGGQHDRWKG
jgi:hypothetical protein